VFLLPLPPPPSVPPLPSFLDSLALHDPCCLYADATVKVERFGDGDEVHARGGTGEDAPEVSTPASLPHICLMEDHAQMPVVARISTLLV